MIKHIGVIGCGWLGLPLAQTLAKKEYTVSGTTTSTEKLSLLSESGIVPFQISLSEKRIEGAITEFLEPLDVLVINIPPGLRGSGKQESYVGKIKLLYAHLKTTGPRKVLFISSTSVYGEATGTLTEKDIPAPSSESGRQLLECERLFRNDQELHSTIIRFGGLIGPDRHPISMLSGRENLKAGNAPVNLIHQDDCIQIITSVIEMELWDTVINAVHPYHPTKREYYTHEAIKRGLKPPLYLPDTGTQHKLIDSCNPFLINNYVFLTPIN
ncbi:MAG: SDR family oxidoreductase [Maribacter sp.]